MTRAVSRGVRTAAVLAAVFGLGLYAIPAARAADGVDPKSVEVSLDPGGTHSLDKVVHTPAVSANPDIVFLADLTGSMGGAVSNVQANISDVMSTIAADQPTAQFGAAFYRDFDCDDVPFEISQAVTATTASVQTAVDAWVASGGCDSPEAQINALYELATSSSVGWRTGSSRIIAWFGDAPGHDPSNGHTLADANAALQAVGIRVVAVDLGYLDEDGQATAITDATGGVIVPDDGDVSGAILDGIQSLDATVTHEITCDPGLAVSVSPESRTVSAGADATFTEKIDAAPDAEAGSTLHCTVQFLVNGGASESFAEAVTVHVGGGGEKTPTEMVPMKAGAIKTKEGALKVPVVWSELVDPATGKGIPGKHVSFFVGEALLCETTTGPHGWAHCGGEVAGAGDRIGDGYEAVFAGDDTHEASSAHGTFFRLLPCTPKPPKWHWPWDWSHHHGGAR